MLSELFVIAVLALPFGLFASLVGLVLRRVNGDLRKGFWIAVLSLPIWLTGAWDLVALGLVIVCLLSGLSIAFDRLGNRAWRPSIQTLLVAIAFMAAVFLTARGAFEAEDSDWLNFLLIAVATSVWTFVGGYCLPKILGSQRSLKVRFLCGGCAVSIAVVTMVVTARFDQLARNLYLWGTWPADPDNLGTSMFALIQPGDWDIRWFPIGILVLLIAGSVRCLNFGLFRSDHSPLSRFRKLRLSTASLLLFASFIFTGGIWWILARPSGLQVTSPESNAAHAQLMKSVRSLAGLLAAPDMMDPELPADQAKLDIQRLLELQDQAKGRIRESVIMIPRRGTMEDLDIDRGMDTRQAARVLAFATESAICQVESKQSVDNYMFSIYLFESVFSKGLKIDDLIRNACVGCLNQVMWRRRAELGGGQLLRIAKLSNQALARLDSAREIEARDRAWGREAIGWFGCLQEYAVRLDQDEIESVDFMAARKLELARTRLFITEMLLEAYRQRKGNFPDSALELTAFAREAGISADVLLDPFGSADSNETGTASYFRYSAQGNGYLLYSIGENQIDELGESDLFADAPTEDRDDIQLAKLYEQL